MMKEQGAGRACKDDWAQIVGDILLPETLSHPEGLSWGPKCLKMACLCLMGRAMTSAMMKIAPFLPKRSKIMRPRHQNQNQSKNLQKQSNGHTKNQKDDFFFKNEPGVTILKNLVSSKPVSRLWLLAQNPCS